MYVDGIDDGVNDFVGCYRVSFAIERIVEYEKFFGCGVCDVLCYVF